MAIINAKRLRDYPRLMFLATWLILAINLLLRQGWLGGFNQIIGTDFITLYSAGIAYRTDLTRLYDTSDQLSIQQGLIQPTQLSGVNPFISPPYVAAAYSLLTHIPLPAALAVWTILSIGCVIVAVFLCRSLLPEWLKSRLSLEQLLIIVLSFFPFIEGLLVGQNHALSLLLVTLLLLLMLKGRWIPAGILAGLMIYKPQFVIGFLIIWIVWRKYKALGAFIITSLIWAGSIYVINGIESYKTYLGMSQDLLLLPYIKGFPGYLLTTFYGLLTTIFPSNFLPAINVLSAIFTIAFCLLIIWLAYMFRKSSILEATPVIVLAIIFPVLAFPYALLHDLVIIIPAFILWSYYSPSYKLLYTAIGVYLGCFVLSLVDTLTKITFLPLIPMGLTALILFWVLKSHSIVSVSQTQ